MGDTTSHAETIASSVTEAGQAGEVGAVLAHQWDAGDEGRLSTGTTGTGTHPSVTPTKRATGNVLNATSTITPDEHAASNVTELSRGAGAPPVMPPITGKETGFVGGAVRTISLVGLSVSDVGRESRELVGGGPPTSLYV